MPALHPMNMAWPNLAGQPSAYWLFGAVLFSYIALQLVQVSLFSSYFQDDV